MCGISGKLDWHEPVPPELVERMCDRLRHRGPDGYGVEADGPICFGHRRLAIIDLSDAGRQPMRSTCGKLLLTFNGEIYNFMQLRGELERLGSVFRSRSDSEVILEAYRHFGLECFSRFNGMFALALWDGARQRLVLARDRLGKKPLYYRSFENGALSFASELAALMEDRAIVPALDDVALVRYLSLGYTTSGDCIQAGVAKLPPASYLLLERSRPAETVRYWDLAARFRDKTRMDEVSAAREVGRLLDDAVRLRLVSDVPLGAFLSGGIDSSAIASAMKRLRPESRTLTFSIGFDEAGFSELAEAERVARHLDITHLSEIVSDSVAAELPAIAASACEPFADTSMIPMYVLARFARRSVTVALSGDGADEIFAGYETYIADKLRHAVPPLPAAVFELASRAYRAIRPRDLGKVSTDFKILQFLKGCALPPGRSHYSWRELFTDAEKRRLLRPRLRDVAEARHPYQQFAAFEMELEGCHHLDRAMYVDIKTWLADDILVKVDRMSMAHSLEARAPFLDYRLVELAASLPVELKLRGFEKKRILKASQRSHLPADTLARRKSGFNAPISHWLAGALDGLCKQIIQDSPIFDQVEPDYARALIEEHRERRADNSFKLLALIMLHLWQTSRAATLRKAA